MSDTADAVTEPAGEQVGEAQSKPQSLEELLADLDEDRRKVILEQVNKPRNEAKNLRERLKAAEPQLAEYNRLVEASKTEQERALEAQTKAEQRATAAITRVARAEVKAALAGVVDNADAIVDDLNLGKFVDADGEVDTGAIEALRAKYAGFSGRRAPRPDHSQASGANGPAAASPANQFASILQGQLRQQ